MTSETHSQDTNQIGAEDSEVSYEEILANLALNGELMITIPEESETSVKNGIKNFKSKQNTKLKAEGLPPDTSTLEFNSYPSDEYEGCVRIHIIMKKKAVIVVKKIELPSGDFN